jgi:hypothetical protein
MAIEDVVIEDMAISTAETSAERMGIENSF